MVYIVCIDNNDGWSIIDVCDTKEKAQACLRLNAEYDWAENWETLDSEKDDLECFDWTDDYYNVEYYDTRTTIYIVEKEIK